MRVKAMTMPRIKDYVSNGVPVDVMVSEVVTEAKKEKRRFKLSASINKTGYEDVRNTRGDIRLFANLDTVKDELAKVGISRWEFNERGKPDE